MNFPLTIRHASGRLTEVLFNATQYPNSNGKVDGIFAAARDVTQQKYIEKELLQAKLVAEQANQASLFWDEP